jgi:hypothetical protein
LPVYDVNKLGYINHCTIMFYCYFIFRKSPSMMSSLTPLAENDFIYLKVMVNVVPICSSLVTSISPPRAVI